MTNTLYKIYDSEGVLLYVGATSRFGSRLATHAATQPWWGDAVQIELEHFDDLDQLLEAEKAAITIYGPKYNVIHSKPHHWAMKPRRPKGSGTVFQRADGWWVGRLHMPPRTGTPTQLTAVRRTREEVEEMMVEFKQERDRRIAGRS